MTVWCNGHVMACDLSQCFFAIVITIRFAHHISNSQYQQITSLSDSSHQILFSHRHTSQWTAPPLCTPRSKTFSVSLTLCVLGSLLYLSRPPVCVREGVCGCVCACEWCKCLTALCSFNPVKAAFNDTKTFFHPLTLTHNPFYPLDHPWMIHKTDCTHTAAHAECTHIETVSIVVQAKHWQLCICVMALWVLY